MQFLLLPSVILSFVFIQIQINGQHHVPMSTCGLRLTQHKPLMTNAPTTSHWPWHAAIYRKVNESALEYICGGTVITSRAILTAGHCVSRDNEPIVTTKLSISLGRLNLGRDESTGQHFKVFLKFCSSYELTHFTGRWHYSTSKLHRYRFEQRHCSDSTCNWCNFQ